MTVSFEDKQIREICEDQYIAESEIGFSSSIKLHDRLADIVAASSINDLIVGNLKEIQDKNGVIYKIDICELYELVFKSNHIPTQTIVTGPIERININKIKILAIQKK